MKYLRNLYVQVLIAIVIGILLGHFYPSFATELKPLGDAFIKLIKMIIAPVIFCTIVTGIAGMQDTKKVGRVGLKAILYFEVVTTLALIIGLFVQLSTLFIPTELKYVGALVVLILILIVRPQGILGRKERIG